MCGQQEAFHKGFFIVSRTRHSGHNDLVAKRNTAVGDAEIIFSAHAVAAGITGEMRFFYVEFDSWSFAGGGV